MFLMINCSKHDYNNISLRPSPTAVTDITTGEVLPRPLPSFSLPLGSLLYKYTTRLERCVISYLFCGLIRLWRVSGVCRPLQSNEAELEDLMYNLCSQISFGRLSLNSISSLASIGLIDLFFICSKFLDVSDQTRQVTQLFTADGITFQYSMYNIIIILELFVK